MSGQLAIVLLLKRKKKKRKIIKKNKINSTVIKGDTK